MADIRHGIIIRTFFLFASFSVPSFLTLFKRFWSNETGKGSLSKVVQQVRKYLQHNFQKDWSSTSEVIADICDGIIIRTSFICFFSVPSFLALFKHFWSNETGKGSLSKVVQQVRKYLQLNFQKDWSSTSEVMADIRDGIIIRTSFLFASFSVPSFLMSFKRFWSNETGKGSLSKVVQQVRKYLQLNFQKDWSSTSEVMADIRDGIIIRTFFLFASFSVLSFLGVIWALWPNETGKGSLSKVVQRVRNYLQLNFQKDWLSISRVMTNFRNSIIIIICFFLFASFSVLSFLGVIWALWPKNLVRKKK